MANRSDITATLNSLVEKRMKSKHNFWASEVAFDKHAGGVRVDYLGFDMGFVNNVVMPSSVELGTFSCYEVKSCLADFHSGNGLNFIGDFNYLVCTRELADQLQELREVPWGINHILVPDKPANKLMPVLDRTSRQRREYPASIMLWQMLVAKGATHDTKEEVC